MYACCRNIYAGNSLYGFIHKNVIPKRGFRKINKTKVSTPGPPQTKASSLVPTPFGDKRIPLGTANISTLGRSALFAVVFSTSSFVGAAIWEYENIRARVTKKMKTFGSMFAGQNQVNNLKGQIESWWRHLSKGEKMFAPILCLNVIVFLMWKVPNPKLQAFMLQYFCSNPASRAVCWPMFLSTFSHYSFFHLFANMYVLHSFSNIAVTSLGKEQFLGLYLSAGVIASFMSYISKTVTIQPGLSLGASGAIMGILAYVCCEFPDTRLNILFLPMFSFTAASAIKAIILFDFLGVMCRWKIFDHAAHLGGALFGLYWSMYGKDSVWPQRERFIKYYHELRNSK